ncbi:MAG: tetratricopeptide repeat protein, partial [Cyanobacteria bacterium REEB65]|nr:tetratricopeptide repeat protein [Cyanobacteria bacterium REEB65]
DAAVTYRKVLALDPGNPDVRVDFGTTLYYQRQPMEAIAQFRRVLDTHPRQVQALVNMGVVYQSLGRTDQAAQEWHTALELASDPAIKTKIRTMLEGLLASPQ